MSFSIFKPRYEKSWQVIITKFDKILYNKLYDTADYMLDIKNKTGWSDKYKYEVEHLANNITNVYYKFNDGVIVKILMLKEEL